MIHRKDTDQIWVNKNSDKNPFKQSWLELSYILYQ